MGTRIRDTPFWGGEWGPEKNWQGIPDPGLLKEKKVLMQLNSRVNAGMTFKFYKKAHRLKFSANNVVPRLHFSDERWKSLYFTS